MPAGRFGQRKGWGEGQRADRDRSPSCGLLQRLPQRRPVLPCCKLDGKCTVLPAQPAAPHAQLPGAAQRRLAPAGRRARHAREDKGQVPTRREQAWAGRRAGRQQGRQRQSVRQRSEWGHGRCRAECSGDASHRGMWRHPSGRGHRRAPAVRYASMVQSPCDVSASNCARVAASIAAASTSARRYRYRIGLRGNLPNSCLDRTRPRPQRPLDGMRWALLPAGRGQQNEQQADQNLTAAFHSALYCRSAGSQGLSSSRRRAAVLLPSPFPNKPGTAPAAPKDPCSTCHLPMHCHPPGHDAWRCRGAEGIEPHFLSGHGGHHVAPVPVLALALKSVITL